MLLAAAGSDTTLIFIAIIGAVAAISSAFITAFFAYLMVKVKRTAEQTYSIVNHDRTIMLEGQAYTLRLAAIQHPEDEGLQHAADRAEEAAQHAREANERAKKR